MPETFQHGDDVDVMCDEFGVSVVIGAVTANAIVNRTSKEMLAALGLGGLWGRAIDAKFKTGKFPAVAVEGVVTIEGVAYRVVRILEEQDGGVTRLVAAVEL